MVARHADGANMLADALAPHGGIVMWRAFVYSLETDEDRAKQAYNEFKPLDGKFASNVIVQVKNGPIDFQPREPFHPLFGAMPQHAADDGSPDHQGISRLRHPPRLPRRRCGRRRSRAGHLATPHRGGRVVAEHDRTAWPGWRISAPTATGAAPISTRRTGTRSAAWRGTRRRPPRRSPRNGRA